MNQSSATSSAAPENSSSGALFLAWAFVGIPLIWGVSQTFVKALTLFQ